MKPLTPVGKYRGSYDKITPPVQISLRTALEEQFGDKISFPGNGAWEYGLTIATTPAEVTELFSTLKNGDKFLFNMLIDVTAVDWLDDREPRFEVIYHLLSLTHMHRLGVKVGVDEDEPKVASVLPLWPAANFLEREVWDMFGIEFEGHGDLRRIMMYDEFVGHPLRKDYPITGKQPRLEMRIPELRNTSADMKKDELVSLPTRRGHA